MEKTEREAGRRNLDKELYFYRLAARRKNSTPNLLRAVRQALGIPVMELSRLLGKNRSNVFEMERSEGRGTITLNSMDRLAGAMGCKLVYAIVPLGGKTLGEMADERRVMEKVKRQGSEIRDQGLRVRDWGSEKLGRSLQRVLWLFGTLGLDIGK